MPGDSTSERPTKRPRFAPEVDDDDGTPQLLGMGLPLSLQPEPLLFFNQHRRELAAKKRQQRWLKPGWARPTLAGIEEATDSIVFQVVDVVEDSSWLAKDVLVFGVTKDGHSVLARVVGVCPYFYVDAPDEFSEDHLQQYLEYLNSRQEIQGALKSVSLVYKNSLLGYTGPEQEAFIKIELEDWRRMRRVQDLFKCGDIHFNNIFDETSSRTTYEGRVPFALRFMVDQDISVMDWLELPPGSYEVAKEPEILSYCQIEVKVSDCEKISLHERSDSYCEFAPLRTLYVDVKTQLGSSNRSGSVGAGPIVQIVSIVKQPDDSTPFIQAIFTLGPCDPVDGADIIQCESEENLILDWSHFVNAVDPDVVIGYKLNMHDLTRVVQRASAIFGGNHLRLGRLNYIVSNVTKTHMCNSQKPKICEYREVALSGRLRLDMMLVLLRERAVFSLPVKHTSGAPQSIRHCFEEHPADVSAVIGAAVRNGNPNTRGRLAAWGLQDAQYVLQLEGLLKCFVSYVEVARAAGTPLHYLLKYGPSIKVLSLILRHGGKAGFLVPDTEDNREQDGAIVVESQFPGEFDGWPSRGLDDYWGMMGGELNLCYTTILDASLKDDYEHSEISRWEPGDTSDGGNYIYFVDASHRQSLLVAILDDLHEMRDRIASRIDYEDRDSPSDYGQDALDELGSWTPRDIKDKPENWKLARRCAALEACGDAICDFFMSERMVGNLQNEELQYAIMDCENRKP